MSTDKALIRRASSARPHIVCQAIAQMVHEQRWLLDESALSRLSSRRNAVIDGWIFVHRTLASVGLDREEAVLKGLRADNPRVREQACDLIGDLELHTLLAELRTLFEDDDHRVREAARFNHDMLAKSSR